MRYATVCSGIEAPSVALHPLGWQPMFFSEVEKFPKAVLAHHYPDVPDLGDMTTIDGPRWRGEMDVLIGGTPCQSFSVAGQRRGLEDPRGNLTVKFVDLCDQMQPHYIVWENVPGVLSDRNNAFGCFLGGLAGEDEPLVPAGKRWTNAGYVLGPERAIAWRVLDAQYFGVAQRRRRVFLVACPRNGADPREVLFEREGVRRDTAPRRSAGERVADSPAQGVALRGREGGGTAELTGDVACALRASQGGGDKPHVAQCITTGTGRRYDADVATTSAVRRLTPVECERLQGFPDNYTAIPYRNGTAADGPRYKALGNAMAVPVVRWIGRGLLKNAKRDPVPRSTNDL